MVRGRSSAPDRRGLGLGLTALFLFGLVIFFTVPRGHKGSDSVSPNTNTLSAPPFSGEIDDRAPDFSLEDLSGDVITLSSFQDRPLVVLVFWSLTCEPCLAQLRSLNSVRETLGARMEALAVNRGDARDAVQQFVQREGLKIQVLTDEEDRVGSRFQERSPASMFFLKEEMVVGVAIGAVTPEQLKAKIARLLSMP